MSTLQLSLDHQLARAAAWTSRLKERRDGRGILTYGVEGLDFLARGFWHVWRNRRYLTATKLINMALVNVQFHMKTQRVVGRPYRMKIESTNICNTKCQLCPTGIGLKGRSRGKMSFDRYRRVIDQLKRYLVAVDLSMWGDPLIVPGIYDMIRYAHDAGIWTYISTNLHAYKADQGHAELIVNSGLNELTCSLHGATQETFEIYQPGKRFDEAAEKVRQIVAARRRLGSDTPRIRLNFVVTRHNEHEREAFTRLAERLDCEAVFSSASMNVRFLGQDKKLTPLGLAPDVLADRTRRHLETWLPKDTGFVLSSYREMLEGSYEPEQFNGRKLYNCDWPWRAAVINWDGHVVTCCGSFDPADDMGNVFRRPFDEIWNGPKYRTARRSFRRRVSDRDARSNPCASCPGFMV